MILYTVKLQRYVKKYVPFIKKWHRQKVTLGHYKARQLV